MNIASRKWLRPALGAAAAVVIIAVLLASQPWSGTNPQSVLARASNPETEILSYRMRYSSEEAKGGTVLATYAEVAYAPPDRFHLTLSMGDWTREYIHIGESYYERETGTPVYSGTQVIFFSTYVPHKEATLHELEQLIDVEALPDEKIDGVECYRLRGRYDEPSIDEKMADVIKEQVTEEEYQLLMEQYDWDSTEMTLDFWISKDDYLIRKVQYETRNQGGEVIRTETMTYYDFNQPIVIEPPLDAHGELLPGWELAGDTSGETHFDTEINYEIIGEDPAHSQISLSVTITNVGMEATASDVRVSFRNGTTKREDGEAGWINAEPSTSEPVNLKSGESETFSASWEYDASHITKDELTEQLERTVIRIAYITPEGNEATRMYSAGGAPYPTAVPPEGPPD